MARKSQGTGGSGGNANGVSTSLNGSRFGVRKRVRTVLDKAKKRTGIENGSTGSTRRSDIVYNGSTTKRNGATVRPGPSVVAKVASAVVDDEGHVDVIPDYVTSPRKENDNQTAQLTKGSSLAPKYEDSATLSTTANDVTGVPKSARNVTSPRASDPESSTENESPEDDLVLTTPKNQQGSVINDNKPSFPKKDAFTPDASAAFYLPPSPLPFTLPDLTSEQNRRLMAGERIQYQDDMGLAGSGFVVWDVKAPASVVWDCLLDFNSYPQTIPTVREVVMFTNTHLTQDYRAEKPVDFEDGTAAICEHGVPSVTRAQFSLSKFRLKIAAVHKYRPNPKGDYMVFTLDPASSNVVLKFAKGVWHTQSNPEGKEGHTRVWLLCELKVSRLLPQWIVDYAAARAMPRATSWLKPQVEAAATLWLKDKAEGGRRQ